MTSLQQIETLFEQLKKHLKTKKISYRELGQRLGMSESNLKRIFSMQSCGIFLLSRICEAAECTLFELVTSAAKMESQYFEFSKDLEDFFVKNFDCFVLFRRMGHSDPQKVLNNSSLSELKKTQFLQKLKKEGLIKFEQGKMSARNHAYLRFPRNSKLREEIESKWVPWFTQRVLKNKNNSNYFLQLFSTGLNEKHFNDLREDFKSLIQKYRSIGFLDQQPGTGPYESVGVCINVGPHRIGYFENGK